MPSKKARKNPFNPLTMPFTLKSRATDWTLTVLLGFLLPFLFQHYVPPHDRHSILTLSSLSHPHLPDIIPVPLILFISYFGPPLIYYLLCPTASRNLPIFTLAIFEANALAIFLTEIFKIMTGRPRPHFASVCIGYDSKTNLCTNPNIPEVWESMKSFPSGHASLAFCVAVFLSLWLVEVLKVKDGGEGGLLKVVACLSPVVFAWGVGVSRTVDYHHFYGDVVGGAVLGSGIGGLVWWSRRKEIRGAEEGELGDSVGYDAVAIL